MAQKKTTQNLLTWCLSSVEGNDEAILSWSFYGLANNKIRRPAIRFKYNPNEHEACTRRGRRLQTQSQPFRFSINSSFDFQFRLLRALGSTPKKGQARPAA
ncbi:unnamed protein product [Prunus brigantina]